MAKDKFDYLKGLIFFCGLMLCTISLFTTPWGESLFHTFLGLFGISPGIPMSDNSTLYIFTLIPLIAGFICLSKMRYFWKGYNAKFNEYNFWLRKLPALVVIIAFMALVGMTPNAIDRIYSRMLHQQTGLRAVSVYATEPNLSFRFTGNMRTYSYGFVLNNHGQEVQSFNIKLVYEALDWPNNTLIHQEVFVQDESGNIKIFILPPGQSHFSGGFTAYRETQFVSGSGNTRFSVVLVNDYEQHNPNLLTRRLM